MDGHGKHKQPNGTNALWLHTLHAGIKVTVRHHPFNDRHTECPSEDAHYRNKGWDHPLTVLLLADFKRWNDQ